MSAAYVLIVVLAIAVALLWRRVRKLEQAPAPPVQPPVPVEIHTVVQRHDVRLQALETSDRKRTLFDLLR